MNAHVNERKLQIRKLSLGTPFNEEALEIPSKEYLCSRRNPGEQSVYTENSALQVLNTMLYGQ